MAWLIAGTAGEGLEAGGEIFSRALAAIGYRPTTQRDFPSRIRGGDTTFTVRLTNEGLLVPPETVELALAFNETVLPRILSRMAHDGLLLVDEGIEAGTPPAGCEVHHFPFTELAKSVGFERSKNMVALGASAALLDVPLGPLANSVTLQFKDKGDKVVALNRAALEAGHGEAAKRWGTGRFATPAPGKHEALFLSGNEAAALGALVAGCRIAAAYPITPASDILEYLTPRLQAIGGTALQMEDEMAALNVLIGAGYAGARAITATSGPGLSLMSETIGFAGSAEVPCVIVDAQRPGPSTGMPTKHGQEDLWHLVHGGHGEFVRVVLSPTGVADAFYATSEAFRLAHKFRCPAFVALDQQQSLFKQTVPPFDLEAEASRHGVLAPNPALAGTTAWNKGYEAYGDTGAQPHRVANPGEPGGRYYSNSTEHAPSGFTTEDPAVRVAMVNRRLARMQAIVEDAHDPVVVAGPADADVVLVSWGSTAQACLEARERLGRRGISARVIGIRLLWPFPRDLVLQAVGNTAPIFIAEANAFAQLSRLVRSELPLHRRIREVLQYDGRPLTSDLILRAVQEAML